MTSNRVGQIKTYLLAVDMLMLNLALYIAPIMAHGTGNYETSNYKFQAIFLNFLWVLVIHFRKLYEDFLSQESTLFIQETFNACIVYLLSAGIVTVFSSLSSVAGSYHMLLFMTVTVLFTSFLLLERVIILSLRKTYREKAPHSNVVLLGNQAMLDRVFTSIQENAFMYNVVGTFDLADGNFNNLLNFLSGNTVHEIYCEYGSLPQEDMQRIMTEADRRMIRLRFLFNYPDFVSRNAKLSTGFGQFPVLTFRTEPLQDGLNQLIKRAFDIFFSLFVILFVMSWLTPILAILIKLDSKGPVFFRQLRSGKNNKPFMCFKFRSMYVNGESDTVQATLNDARFTRVGRFLRRTSLDELPQFFNVLFNTMSIVGPRPHMLAHTEKYKQLLDNYMVRHFVKPGITGWAQVSGYRGETKLLAEMERRVQHDVHYLENWSFFLDLKIVFLTIWLLLKREQKAY